MLADAAPSPPHSILACGCGSRRRPLRRGRGKEREREKKGRRERLVETGREREKKGREGMVYDIWDLKYRGWDIEDG
jgi:hypothetical protein